MEVCIPAFLASWPAEPPLPPTLPPPLHGGPEPRPCPPASHTRSLSSPLVGFEVQVSPFVPSNWPFLLDLSSGCRGLISLQRHTTTIPPSADGQAGSWGGGIEGSPGERVLCEQSGCSAVEPEWRFRVLTPIPPPRKRRTPHREPRQEAARAPGPEFPKDSLEEDVLRDAFRLAFGSLGRSYF